jgi:hypothetical protein
MAFITLDAISRIDVANERSLAIFGLVPLSSDAFR